MMKGRIAPTTALQILLPGDPVAKPSSAA